MNNYLIPANSKKGQLIFGIFKGDDLIIFGVGVGATLLALIIFPTTDIVTGILCLLPALVAALLVFPVANYHNVRTVIKEVIKFYSESRRYIWKGWCSSYEPKKK